MGSILRIGKSDCILNESAVPAHEGLCSRNGAYAEQILPCVGTTTKIVRKRLSSICDFCLESKSVVD